MCCELQVLFPIFTVIVFKLACKLFDDDNDLDDDNDPYDCSI